jgi:hypothetical protein
MKRFEFQLLNNIEAYKNKSWVFPTIGIDINKQNKWIAIILLIGHKSFGFRIYFITRS